jgi:membrane-bound lytic murein transglycosylase B
MRTIGIAALIALATAHTALATTSAETKHRSPSTPTPDWAYSEQRLAHAGFKKPFIQALKAAYEPKDFRNVVELNVVLFLRKADYHGIQVTEEAAARVRKFMSDNEQALSRAEKEHGVPGNVIASLLWIESRFGQQTGRFHVPSVYVHLVQADRPLMLKHLRTDGARRFTERASPKDLAKIPERARRKAEWALGELRALQKMFEKDGPHALGLRGSFAGAFGIPQFLPSSYSRWAKAMDPGKTPDLQRPDDTIQSVAFYLKENGWRQSREKTHFQALLNYNNSRDYANAILTLARNVSQSQTLASTTEAD